MRVAAWFAMIGLCGCGEAEIVLTQSVSSSIAGSITCIDTDTGPPPIGLDASWYRVFPLGDFGVQAFRVTQVSFGVYRAASTTGQQPAEVIVYSYHGPLGEPVLDLRRLTQKAIAEIPIATTMISATITVPIIADVDADAVAIAVHVHDGRPTTASFGIGINFSGETAPGFSRCATGPAHIPAASPDLHMQDSLVISASGYAIPKLEEHFPIGAVTQ